MKKYAFFLVLAVAMCSSLFASTDIDKNFHQAYDVKEGASLILKSGDGNVNVTTWEKDVVDIDIIYRATFTGISRIEPDDFEVEFEKRGDQISVIGHEPRIMGLGARRIQEYKYTIKAPAYVSLDIHGVDGNIVVEERDNNVTVGTVDGNVDIADVEASEVDVESIDGNIKLDVIDADVSAETVDGNIIVDHVTNTSCRCKTIDGNISVTDGTGNFEASSVDGNIELLGISAEKINAHTSDGRIELELAATENIDATLKTGDGNVRVKLANGTSVAIEVNTSDGRIDTDLSPVSDLETDDDMFRGSINGGKGSLSIRTGDGSVSVVEE